MYVWIKSRQRRGILLETTITNMHRVACSVYTHRDVDFYTAQDILPITAAHKMLPVAAYTSSWEDTLQEAAARRARIVDRIKLANIHHENTI